MLVLKYRLYQLGYNPQIFWNFSWGKTLAATAESLHQKVTTFNEEQIHWVGHSFGGLIIAQFFADYPEQPLGRIVTLGTPHNGSLAARRVGKLPLGLGHKFLGRGLSSALTRCPLPLPIHREIGSIAGNINVILGWLLGLSSPNDTLVTVAETQHPDIKASIVVKASHTTMLISGQVAQSIDLFLRTGSFQSVEDKL